MMDGGREPGQARRRAKAGRIVLGVLAAALLAAGVHALFPGASHARLTRIETPSLSAWQAADADQPPITFLNSRSDPLPEPLRASARMLPDGSRREDTLLAGDWNGGGPFVALTAERAKTLPNSSFAVELIRRAADAGLAVIRTEQPIRLATRLGPADIAEATLTGAEARACLAFRLDGEALHLAGWRCPAGPEAAQEVACLIDRIAPGPGADAGLSAMLAMAAPLDPRRCGAEPETTSATTPSADRNGRRADVRRRTATP